jgi:hypothetical protein
MLETGFGYGRPVLLAGAAIACVRFIAAAIAITAVAVAQSRTSTNAFQARMFDASGPVALSPNQTATTCATNLQSESVNVLIALLNATPAPPDIQNTSSPILAVRSASLATGQGVCFSKAGTDLSNGLGLGGR